MNWPMRIDLKIIYSFDLVIIDRGDRKPLLIAGAVGTGMTLAGIAWVFKGTANHGMLLWLLAGYIIGHGFGRGAVIGVYISEVFANAVRAKRQTLPVPPIGLWP